MELRRVCKPFAIIFRDGIVFGFFVCCSKLLQWLQFDKELFFQSFLSLSLESSGEKQFAWKHITGYRKVDQRCIKFSENAFDAVKLLYMKLGVEAFKTAFWLARNIDVIDRVFQ